MADKKISALPAATTPLAGTEVLPVVQGGATDQVSVANLTVGRDVVANSYQVSNRLKVNSTWIADAVAPTGNDTGLAFSSRIYPCDSAGNLTNNTLSLGSSLYQFSSIHTGDNVVIGTAGKGIDFSANGGDVLTQYDEGTWTPVFNSLTIGSGSVDGRYTRVGRMVTATARMQFGAGTAWTGTCSTITGLPFASPYRANGLITMFQTGVGWFAGQVMIYEGQSQTSFPTNAVGVAFSAATPWVWASGDFVVITLTYEV